MTEVYLLLGSNLGERFLNLEKASLLIASRCGKIEMASSIYETDAWGIKEQNNFLNMAVKLTTQLYPQELLNTAKTIEIEMGRTESMKWGPRLIDIDILLYGDQIVEMSELKIPHPHLHERKFTLIPLAEVASDAVHPVYKLTIAELLKTCKDNSEVKLFAA